jgi:hypothetical protein
LPYVRIENTNYPPPLRPIREYDNLKEEAEDINEDLIAGKEPKWPTGTPADAYEMNRMRWNPGVLNTDLKASFSYQNNWPILINAQPSQGGLLSTSQMKGAKKYLRFFCLNQCHFAYDVVYPVKLTIRDEYAFNGEGYNFQIAFPVIIEDNREQRTAFGARKFVVPDQGGDFCDNLGNEAVDVRALGFRGGPTAEELPNANITYRCLHKECLLGSTYSDGTGAIRLSAYLPEGCSNPLILANKEGYLQGQEHATGLTEIYMTKLQKMNYTITIHPYYEEVDKTNPFKVQAEQWLMGQEYETFTKTMHATVAISLRDQVFDQYKTYPANAEAYRTGTETGLADIKDLELDEIQLVESDASYDIDIMLFKGNTIVGGYHAENITITYEEIAGAQTANFHIVEYRPLPEQSHQQAGMFTFLYERGKYEDGSAYQEALRPTFR